MARRTIRTETKRKRFLEALTATASVTRAAQAAAAHRSAFYDWRRDDSGFAADWEEALERGVDALEDEAFRRALEGVEEPVFYRGQQVALVRKYSDALLMFLLKARRPERFKDRAQVDIKDGRTDEQIEARIAELLRKEGVAGPAGGTAPAPEPAED